MTSKVEIPSRVRRRGPREAALDSPNPVDIAMAVVASGKPMPDIARRVLEEQADLLHAQRIELRMRHVGETVRAALWAILAVTALAIMGLIATVLVRAARSDTLIVQSFRVPPALAIRGLSGEVIASQVLDMLAEMQATTQSSRSASSYANNWEDDLKIDIPNTGATIDQLWKFLRGWLGKETRISGEVFENGGKLALTARVGSEPGRTFISDKADLKQLVTEGAESIFKSTQPYRYAIYLGQTGRPDERLAALKRLATNASPIERKWAFNGQTYDNISRGRFREALVTARRALAIDPTMIPALNNAASAHSSLGHMEQAVAVYRRSISLPVGTEFDPVQVEANRCGVHLSLGQAVRDPVEVEAAAQCMEMSPAAVDGYLEMAGMLTSYLRHELGPALNFQLAASGALAPATAQYLMAFAHLIARIDQGRSPALGAALDNYAQLAANQTDTESRARVPTEAWPTQAEALATLGRIAEAQALIAKTPLDCYDCLRTRGLIAARANQPMAAQRWYAEAVRQGPSLAPAYVDWARLLAAHRRFDGAEARFAKAAKLAPNWVDPLKYWGDALIAQDKRKEALAKYAAALDLAPKWGDLRQATSRVAK